MSYDFISCVILAGLCLPDRTAKRAERVSATARAPGAGVRKRPDLACPLSERCCRHPRFFAVLDLLLLLDQAKSREEQAVDSHAPLRFARNDNSDLSS